MATNMKESNGMIVGNISAMVAIMAALATLFGSSGVALAGVEVSTGANGNALVRGAKVTAVSGTQVNAKQVKDWTSVDIASSYDTWTKEDRKLWSSWIKSKVWLNLIGH